VTYQSTAAIFSTGTVLLEDDSGTPPSVFSSLANYPFIALGGIISEGQGIDSNLVAESVITFGVKSFGLKPYARDDTYLQLYAQMIQGILEYETSYVRMLYSLDAVPPPSCIRTVSGSVSYAVFGWFVTSANIGFLIPWTLVNGVALAALLLAVIKYGKLNGYPSPLQAREVYYDPESDEQVPPEWKEKIDF